MKKTVISAALLVVASILVAIGVAEISFPESFLTFTDQDWLIDIWPKAYRYNIQVGLAAIIIATGICVPAYRLQKDFAIRALETLFRVGIGGMFIFASIYKIQDRQDISGSTPKNHRRCAADPERERSADA